MKSTSKLVAQCYQSVVDNDRHHGVVLDLPGAKGGDDLDPTALELAVMALSGASRRSGPWWQRTRRFLMNACSWSWKPTSPMTSRQSRQPAASSRWI